MSKNTVTKLSVDLGTACDGYQNHVKRDLRYQRLQCDATGSFCYAQEKHVSSLKTTPAVAGVVEDHVWTI